MDFHHSIKAGTLVRRMPLAPTKNRGPFILIVDPQEIAPKQIKKVLNALQLFRRSTEKIIPATVMTLPEFGERLELPPHSLDQYFWAVRDFLSKTFRRYQVLGIEEPQVFHEAGFSSRKPVRALLQYAEEVDAQALVAGYGGSQNSTWGGFDVFVETLLGLSSLPVILLGPNVRPLGRVRTIFYPTDFNQPSKRTFMEVLGWAREKQAKVLVYHQQEVNSEPLAWTGAGVPLDPRWIEEAHELHLRDLKRKAKRWVEVGLKAGVETEVIFDRSSAAFPARVLTHLRNRDVGLLALSIHRGPLGQLLMGGNVRQLLARVECPVLAIHTKDRIR